MVSFSKKLVNPNSSKNTQRLMKFLCDNYTKKIIAGQMDLAWNDSVDMAQRVYDETQKYPALMGYDFMCIQNKSGPGRKQVKEAIDWWNGKINPDKSKKVTGIVAFCWHWYMAGPSGQSAFYVNGDEHRRFTDYKIPYDTKTKSWDVKSKYYKEMMKDLHGVAKKIKKMCKLDIPILWRPLHEASGGWFWWGASGDTFSERAETCIALWKLIFKYFTEDEKLNNLIWVWNGQDKAFYPGDEYVDIIGEDIYPGPKNYESQKDRWQKALSYSDSEEKKIIALSENGAFPDLDNLVKDDVWWSWFMTWNDCTKEENVPHQGNFWTGDFHNDIEHKRKVYNSELVITLDKMPDLREYEI